MSSLAWPFAQSLGCPSVMIVEDEALIALSLEEACQDEGFRVMGSFATCVDALTALTSVVPDVAILDSALKDGSCLELARELRRRNVPFLMYSGRDAVEEHAPELDGVPWIDKPSPSERVLRGAIALIHGSPLQLRT